MRFLLPLLAVGCAVKGTSFQALQPAAVAVPADVQTLLVLDKASPETQDSALLSRLEARDSGESPFSDEIAIDRTLDELLKGLERSPRYEVKYIRSQGNPDVPGGKLTWDDMRALADKYGAQAIVSLEMLDTNNEWFAEQGFEEVERDGRTVRQLVWTASQSVEFMSTFRYYHPEREVMLDESVNHQWRDSYSGQAPSEQGAFAALPPPEVITDRAAGEIGGWYARRIAPSPIRLYRRYYSGKGPLKAGHQAVARGDWKVANQQWRKATRSDDDKIVNRAWFNLALIGEKAGDYAKARARLDKIEPGRGVSKGKLAEAYRNLDRSEKRQRKLDAQMH